jgi:cytochrome c oxidase subunit I+III
MAAASRLLRSDGRARPGFAFHLAFLAAVPLLVGGSLVDFIGQWQTGLRPDQHSYGALIYTIIGLEAFLIATVTVMALYVIARALTGRLNGVRRASFDNTLLLWHYTVVQGLIGLAVIHLFPMLVGGV